MKSLALKKLLILGIFLFISQISQGSVIIDSVKTTNSSCTNNGSAILYARSNPVSTLLYAIVAGAIISPLQNSTTFSSLFPGTYKVRAYTSNFDSTEVNFTITGNYQLPNFTLYGIDPTCPGFNDGTIQVIMDSSKGLQPYLYSMTSPSAVASNPSNYFQNLNSNTYLIRVTDACGNYQTRTEILTAYGTGLTVYGQQLYPSLTKIGCDTFELSQFIYLYNEKANLPLTLTTNTPNGTTVTTQYPIVIDSLSYNPGYYKIVDTIPNVTYGDYLNFNISDVCGAYTYSVLNQIPPFLFDVTFSATVTNCTESYTAGIQLEQWPNYPYYNTSPLNPFSYTLRDLNSNTIVDSNASTHWYLINISQQQFSGSYELMVTDICGDSWSHQISWPTVGSPTIKLYTSIGCNDSTAQLIIEHHNFKGGVKITFLTGPSIVESTKPKYTYRDTIIYPKVIYGGLPNWIYIQALPVGYYTFEISDSCGNVISGNITIDSTMVSNYLYTYDVKPSCLNNNTLYYNLLLGNSQGSYYTIYNLDSNKIVKPSSYNYGLDSISTLNIGNYLMVIDYGYSYYDGSIKASGSSCWTVYDTISITPYINNSFITNNTILCNGTNYVELITDSTRGVPPYKFEIISGPQTFAQQDSGIFQINIFGNYLLSLEDVCGNNYTQQITVSSDSFPPILKDGFICSGQYVVLSAVSSPHFNYNWQFPNGTIVAGDSIIFNPFMPSDTGNYNITKIVNVNGCNDTLHSVYHLGLNDSIPQLRSICQGDTILVGNSIYTLPGVYYDTLSTTFGCDSVIVTTIKYNLILTDTLSLSICSGDSVLVGNHSYHLPGIYSDTLTTNGNCKKISITNLTFNNSLDSTNAFICLGDSITLGGISYSQAGIYRDTLVSSLGCDSIVVTSITINPLTVDSNSIFICFGDSITIGNNVYYAQGNYTDTLQTAGGCKKINYTVLTVYHFIDSISTSICNGDSILIGNTHYTTPGIYNDTLISSQGCDSIIIATITLTNFVIDTNTISICKGDSVTIGANVYTLTGTYTDTLPVSGGCKKIIITNLSVNHSVDSISAAICLGDSITIGNNTYSISGTYNDTLVSSLGCDSILVATITINKLPIDSNSISICHGDSLNIGFNTYTVTGNYIDTINVIGGCKKIMFTNLTVNLITDSVLAIICQGDSISIGNNIYFQPGVYNDTLITSNGCDSLVVTSLSFTNLLIDSNHVKICSNDSVVIGSSVYFLSGIYTDTISISGNCKKIIVTDIQVKHIVDSVQAQICTGDSINIGNVFYSQPGIFVNNLISANGCDSTIVLTLTQTISGLSNSSVTICEGDSIIFGNNHLKQSGIYSIKIPTSGCDSTVILDLTIEPKPNASIYVTSDTIQAGVSIPLISTNTNATGYLWYGNAYFTDPNLPNTNAILNNAAWIYLTVTNSNNCSNTDSLFMRMENNDGDNCEDAYLFIPNTFTPNQDGINDTYKIISLNINVKSFLIFNRWGAKVFEASTYNDSWNGKFTNEDCPEGVYYFLIHYDSCADKSNRSKHGSITLLR